MFRKSRNLLLDSLDVHGIENVAVFAYFDGSERGGARKELTLVAGYLFDHDGAHRFMEQYRRDVEPPLPPDEHGVKMFHASPLFDGDEHFAAMQRPIREAIIGRMAGAIKDCALLGVVVAIENVEYDRGLRGRYIGVKMKGVRAETLVPWVGSKYSLCLLRCIHGINSWLDQEKIDGRIEYTMEGGERPDIEQEATAIFSRLAGHPRLRHQYRIGRYGFTPKSPDTPWLCAADYIGWVWQQNDRASEEPERERDRHGDWETPVVPLIETRPHMVSYLTEKSVNFQALVNAFNGLMRPGVDGA